MGLTLSLVAISAESCELCTIECAIDYRVRLMTGWLVRWS